MRRDELSAPSVAASLPLLEDLMRLVTVPLPQYIHHPGPATSVSRIYPSVLYDNFMGTRGKVTFPRPTSAHCHVRISKYRTGTSEIWLPKVVSTPPKSLLQAKPTPVEAFTCALHLVTGRHEENMTSRVSARLDISPEQHSYLYSVWSDECNKELPHSRCSRGTVRHSARHEEAVPYKALITQH